MEEKGMEITQPDEEEACMCCFNHTEADTIITFVVKGRCVVKMKSLKYVEGIERDGNNLV